MRKAAACRHTAAQEVPHPQHARCKRLHTTCCCVQHGMHGHHGLPALSFNNSANHPSSGCDHHRPGWLFGGCHSRRLSNGSCRVRGASPTTVRHPSLFFGNSFIKITLLGDSPKKPSFSYTMQGAGLLHRHACCPGLLFLSRPSCKSLDPLLETSGRSWMLETRIVHEKNLLCPWCGGFCIWRFSLQNVLAARPRRCANLVGRVCCSLPPLHAPWHTRSSRAPKECMVQKVAVPP